VAVSRVFTSLLFCICVAWGTDALAQDRCVVADPSGTPLNVRSAPEGTIVQTLINGFAVKIVETASSRGKPWVYVARANNNEPLGWVFREYLNCDRSATKLVQPSFNCKSARAPDELVICANPELSQLDNAIVSGYAHLRQAKGDLFAKQTTVPLFQARQACGANRVCIRDRQIEAIRTYQGLGAPINFSIWTHNGSMVDLISIGHSRTYFYQTPRPELADAGVRAGTLLFEGESSDQQYFGTAYRFSSTCGQISYRVTGPILDNHERVALAGRAPRIDSNCNVTGSFEDNLEFRLAKQTEFGTQSNTIPEATNDARTLPHSPRTIVQLKNDGGIFVVPVEINGAITLDFVVDSGAADVSVPADVVSTLIRTKTIEPSDFVGEQTYVLADGSEVPSAVFTIKSLRVGSQIVQNVKASVASAKATLLLGQSFLRHFKSWSMDNATHALVLELNN